jgi:excinuclease UvrABC nuclease subunit
MKIEQLIPLPKEKVQFKLSSFKFVPKKAGCYVLTTFDNYILYIGLSDSLFDRFQQHLANPQKTNPTIEGKAIWFYYTIYDPINLAKLERTWINQFVAIHGRLPILNKINSPVS